MAILSILAGSITPVFIKRIQIKAGEKTAFLKAVQLVKDNSRFGLVLMSSDVEAIKAALEIVKGLKPLIFCSSVNATNEIASLSAQEKCPVVATAADLEGLAQLTKNLAAKGVTEIMLDTGKKAANEKIWDLTQIRRLALKKSNRALGFPVITVIDQADPYAEIMEAATYISKYAGIVLIKGVEAWQALALLTLRQNIYTDPQRPLQIEPKIYSIGQATDKSPLLVTTNFSLSYYTVLGEVEASKVPAHILSVDTEGMSVLTAWAAEKFNAEKVTVAMNKSGVSAAVKHKQIIIPGYVAVMSGDLEEQSGWKVIVGPKEAAGIPSFLKNLQ